MKNPKPAVILGSLSLQQSFHLVNRKTIYRTLTYGPSSANPAHGSRYCLNSKNKAVLLACSSKVQTA
jgi:hypothetical protein